MSADYNQTAPNGIPADNAPSEAASAPPPDSAAAQSDPVTATSEANIAATDPNTKPKASDLPTDRPTGNDADIDMMAADTAEGAVSGTTVVAPDTASASTPAPASAKKGKDAKRRSSVIPEHKGKKGGKKKEVVLNLDCKPGDFYFARMKGHPEWPAVVADEEMLPDLILGSRPVTARRHDYSYREDFADGGKNVKDRTYPVMFLGTNEFAWMVNSDLRRLSADDVKEPEKIKGAKKGLLEAYQVAKEFHDLDYFKKILFNFEKARAQEEQDYAEKMAAAEEREAKKAERVEKKAKRKSTATIDDDVEMGDGDTTTTPKSSKKRKKTGAESESEEKPAKTPKIKLNSSKAANGDSAKSKPKTKAAKPKAKEEPQISEAELKDKKEKSVLYLRHKLQKGFLQNTAPQESEMEVMADHFNTLQQYKVLEADIIRATKIHKVLKAILKLDSVPQDDKYNFKKQSNELLQEWNKILADDTPVPTTNGTTETKPDTSKSVQAKSEETPAEDSKPAETPATEPESKSAPVESTTNTGNDAKDEATDGDVSMADVSKTEPAAPAAQSEAQKTEDASATAEA